MASGAMFFESERNVAIVTGSASCSFVHLGHGELLVTQPGDKELGMTLAAIEFCSMYLVAERDAAHLGSLEDDVVVQVTARTVGFDGKRRVAVVAAAAG